MERFAAAVEEAIGGDGLSELASAKINLALHVTGRRSDGFHNLETLVVFADYGDVVSAAPCSQGRMRLSVKGPFADALAKATAARDNLVIRAAVELARAVQKKRLPAMKLSLTKRIPVAAGLGGGSADAAATLRLLNRVWSLGLPPAELAEIGVRLGADIPMCLASMPLVARGIGDQITPVTGMPAMPIVLIHPGVAVATAAVFAALGNEERTGLPAVPAKLGSVLEAIFWMRQARNDLAEPAGAISRAALAPAKALMSDAECLFARMSGSGAAAFGIFVSMDAAERAAARLREARPGWWVAAAMTRPS